MRLHSTSKTHRAQSITARLACIAACAALGCEGTIGNQLDSDTAGPTGTAGTAGTAGTPPITAAQCASGVFPGRAPLRRLTRFEYSNTVHYLLGDTTNPGNGLPSEANGNGFGNDADSLSVPTTLARAYESVAQGIGQRATETPAALAMLAPCAGTVTATTPAATEDACARTIIENIAPRAYRRALVAGEADELLALEKAVRAETTFASAISAVIEAVLQSPDFLYRIEWGVSDNSPPELRRPSGDEMATRLSYLLWSSMPDDTLRAAANAGTLSTAEGVLTQATRMLQDPRSHSMVAFFFDYLLPIGGLTALQRDPGLFPTFTQTIGNLMHQETSRFLEYGVFEDAQGTWPSILSAPYTFVNQDLAKFYGMTAVTGTTFQKVPLDTTQRLGLLTQGGLMAGLTASNSTNPVARGGFIVRKMMCRTIPLPTGDILKQVKPPDPYSGDTARERYSQHSANPVCATCHSQMDPVGLALENYDPIGLFRLQEKSPVTGNMVTIDASGAVPGTTGTVNGPVELAQKIASTEEAQSCFAAYWRNFAYGRVLSSVDDLCTQVSVDNAFKKSGYNVRQLLLSLTQTDAFLYLAAQ